MLIEPRKALNKAFLKIKPNRISSELFNKNCYRTCQRNLNHNLFCPTGANPPFTQNSYSGQ
jgi:hypothetical protein